MGKALMMRWTCLKLLSKAFPKEFASCLTKWPVEFGCHNEKVARSVAASLRMTWVWERQFRPSRVSLKVAHASLMQKMDGQQLLCASVTRGKRS